MKKLNAPKRRPKDKSVKIALMNAAKPQALVPRTIKSVVPGLENISIKDLLTGSKRLNEAEEDHTLLSGVCATLDGIILLQIQENLQGASLTKWLRENYNKKRGIAYRHMGLAKLYLAFRSRPKEKQLLAGFVSGLAQREDGRPASHHPVVKAISRWSKGRSCYQLLKDFERQVPLGEIGGNRHPKCPHCQSNLASWRQAKCPNPECGKDTGFIEETEAERRENATLEARAHYEAFLENPFLSSHEWKLMTDVEMNKLAALLRAFAKEIETWVKIPPIGRSEMTVEELLS